jgi:arsenate reductase
VNSRAIAAMREAGIDISRQKSKTLTPEMVAWADLIITVYGHADDVRPALPAGAEKRHWPLFDPSRMNGREEDIMLVLRAVRDHTESLVQGLIAEMLTRIPGSDPHATTLSS